VAHHVDGVRIGAVALGTAVLFLAGIDWLPVLIVAVIVGLVWWRVAGAQRRAEDSRAGRRQRRPSRPDHRWADSVEKATHVDSLDGARVARRGRDGSRLLPHAAIVFVSAGLLLGEAMVNHRPLDERTQGKGTGQ
jgi:hypothetical protein